MPDTPAIQRLRRSQLKPRAQLEAMGGDIDLDAFNLQMRNRAGIKLISAITDATIERTIEGASTLTVEVDDDLERTIQTSGRLGKGVDVNVDGLFFRLKGVRKAGRRLTLTFEEREVALLRQYNSFIYADRAQVTRAQFALRMIKEVKEVALKWVIPELEYEAPISDAQPGQTIVTPGGPTAPALPDTTDQNTNRAAGIPYVVNLTVKGDPATTEQVGNANVILQTGTAMKVSTKILVCSIMVAIAESTLVNLQGGDRDSAGIFQQRKSQGWPATRNIPVDAAAFFSAAVFADATEPGLSYEMLCQRVQKSGTSDGSNYRPWRAEAEAFVKEFGAATPVETATNNNQGFSPVTGGGQFFMRGRMEQKGSNGILTKENSWDCLQRLAQEVNWRCFVISGTVYFVSEYWLFKSRPFMTINEDTDGVQWIDYDYNEGKKTATVPVACHLSRWSAPPGSIVRINKMGIVNGRWIVNDVERSVYSTEGTVTLKKPLPRLPEPTTLNPFPSGAPVPVRPTQPPNLSGAGGPKSKNIQAQVIAYARSQLGVPYQWGAETPGVAFDCSGLSQAAYGNAGVSIPRVAQAQYGATNPKLSIVEIPQPADLVFYGTADNIHHVGISIGGGQMIDAPHSGAVVRIDSIANFGNDYYGATRPWLVD